MAILTTKEGMVNFLEDKYATSDNKFSILTQLKSIAMRKSVEVDISYSNGCVSVFPKKLIDDFYPIYLSMSGMEDEFAYINAVSDGEFFINELEKITTKKFCYDLVRDGILLWSLPSYKESFELFSEMVELLGFEFYSKFYIPPRRVGKCVFVHNDLFEALEKVLPRRRLLTKLEGDYFGLDYAPSKDGMR